jgi:hypothetical protein
MQNPTDSGESSGRARTGLGAAYKVELLSAFLGAAVPKALLAIDFITPLTPQTQKTSLDFFNVLNFVLQFCPTDPSETELMSRFAKIGIGAGTAFDPGKLSPEVKMAIEQDGADAWAAFAGGVKQLDDGTVTSGDLFGTRPDRTTSISNGPLLRPPQPTTQRRPLGR